MFKMYRGPGEVIYQVIIIVDKNCRVFQWSFGLHKLGLCIRRRDIKSPSGSKPS